MGLFDDLIPQGGQAAPGAGAGRFADLIPKPNVPDLGHIEDETQLVQELDRLPNEQRQAALDKWAAGRVATERAAASKTAVRVADAIGRVSNAIPIAGGLTDEADAAWHSLMGGNYDVRLAYSRARSRAQEEAETPKISTPFGDIYESGVEKALGTVGGAAALPFARPVQGTGILPGAANAAANAVPVAAADAFARGEGGFANRAGAALDTIPEATLASALLGGGLGKLERQFQPNPNAPAVTPSGPNRAAIVRAADAEGVTFPHFLASDNQVTKNLAGAMASQPITGPIIRNAADNTALQMGERAREIADAYSNRGAGQVAGTADNTAAALSAGGQMRDALENWISNVKPGEFNNEYTRLFNLVNPSARIPLTRTRVAAGNLIAKGVEAATPVEEQAVDRVRDALLRQTMQPNGQMVEGLSMNGLKNLRTYIFNLKNDKVLPEAGTAKQSFNSLYDALTQDIDFGFGNRRFLNRGVNPQFAQGEWRRINSDFAKFAEDRERLTKIIGTNADAPAERIVDRLITMAGTKGGADMQQLMLARRAATPQVWDELASAAVRRLGGQGPQAGAPGVTTYFSPDRFLTAYNNLSLNGRRALFGMGFQGSLRESLDNIATLSDRFRDIRRYQNPSGTAQVAGVTTLLGQLAASFAGHPLAGVGAVAQVGGTGVLSWLLSRPAGAQAISRFGNAYMQNLMGNYSPAAFKLATLTLAKHVSDVTGEDERKVADRLAQNFGGGNGFAR